MKSARSAGALVADVSGFAPVVRGEVEAAMPMKYTHLSECGERRRAVLNFQGHAGFDRSIDYALHAYAALKSLIESGHKLVARMLDEIEIHHSLALKKTL